MLLSNNPILSGRTEGDFRVGVFWQKKVRLCCAGRIWDDDEKDEQAFIRIRDELLSRHNLILCVS